MTYTLIALVVGYFIGFFVHGRITIHIKHEHISDKLPASVQVHPLPQVQPDVSAPVSGLSPDEEDEFYRTNGLENDLAASICSALDILKDPLED